MIHTIYEQQRLIEGQMKGEMGSAMEGASHNYADFNFFDGLGMWHI
jgi:hypothetical protein